MESLTQIRLPALAGSFPVAKLHPLYADVVKEIRVFYKGFADSAAYTAKELELIEAEDWPFLACVAWPKALDSRLPWVTKFLCWYILLDTEADDVDALGSDGQRTATLMYKYLEVCQGGAANAAEAHMVDGATVRDRMLLASFTSLFEHFRSDMTPTQFARLSGRCSSLFTLIAKQSKVREEGTVLSPTQLLDLKREISFALVLVPLMEYGAAMELEEHTLAQPEIQEIEVAFGDYIVTSNDILSFCMEYTRRDLSNLPSAFYLSDRSLDLQAAMDLTCELLRNVDRRFCKLYASLSKADFFTPQVKAFVDGLGYMMSGAHEWNWRTSRYHGLNWVAPPPHERQGIMYLEDPPRFKSTATPPPSETQNLFTKDALN